MRNLAVLVVALAVGLVAWPAAAKIQCECPTISAKGKGETSCSAVESNNQCEIDFNLFGPDAEKRSSEVINNAGVQDLAWVPNLGSSTKLWQLQSKILTGTVAVYLFVAAANSDPNLDTGFVKEVMTILNRDDRIVKRYFSEDAAGGAPEFKDLSQPGSLIVRIANGCVEAAVHKKIWVMYKASWSPTGPLPQCTPNPIK